MHAGKDYWSTRTKSNPSGQSANDSKGEVISCEYVLGKAGPTPDWVYMEDTIVRVFVGSVFVRVKSEES
jgi:hypothetical protein